MQYFYEVFYVIVYCLSNFSNHQVVFYPEIDYNLAVFGKTIRNYLPILNWGQAVPNISYTQFQTSYNLTSNHKQVLQDLNVLTSWFL